MTDDDKKFIAGLLSGNNEQGPSFVDMAFKALSFIVTGLVMWIFTVVTDIQQEVQKLTIDSEYSKDSMKKLEVFSSYPRFTEDDFKKMVVPIYGEIEEVKNELSARKDFMNDTESEIEEIRRRIMKIEYKIDK